MLLGTPGKNQAFALLFQHMSIDQNETRKSFMENRMKESQNKEIKTVCGGLLKDPTRFPSAEYQNQELYFCTQACLRAFQKNPVAFLAGEIEHPTGSD